jgi:hypothetical protein
VKFCRPGNHIDFERIKAMAEELGCPVGGLLVLARQNDPFYTGTPSDIAQAEWFAKIWGQGGFRHGAHLRRIHYWCTSQQELLLPNGKPYANTDECWKVLSQASKAARYQGLVSIADIADHKNPDPKIHADYRNKSASFAVDMPTLADPDVWIDGFHVSDYQPYHLGPFVEKGTMNDVLDPVCQRYRANLVTGEGEMSITGVFNLVHRIKAADRPARIFYISDFDPAGKSMPQALARKIEWMIQDEGLDLDVKLRPLVLTLEQVTQYQLPRIPIKESERRGAAFEERYGEGAVELDALEALQPGVLSKIISQALEPYYSRESEREVSQKRHSLEQAIHERIKQISSGYVEEIEALEAMREELESIDVDVDAYEPVQAKPEADDGAQSWLFDSERSYMEQLEAYRSARTGAGAVGR